MFFKTFLDEPSELAAQCLLDHFAFVAVSNDAVGFVASVLPGLLLLFDESVKITFSVVPAEFAQLFELFDALIERCFVLRQKLSQFGVRSRSV